MEQIQASLNRMWGEGGDSLIYDELLELCNGKPTVINPMKLHSNCVTHMSHSVHPTSSELINDSTLNSEHKLIRNQQTNVHFQQP